MTASTDYLLSTLSGLPAGQRAALERELVAVARRSALGDLTADIGHDLANPILAILALVELLVLDAEPGSPLEERLRLVRQTGLELKESLAALLDFSRPPVDRESSALDDAARAAVRLVRHGTAKRLEVDALYPPEPLVVRCGPGPLVQAALHLLAAAREATGDAGPIVVGVAQDDAHGILRVSPAREDGLGIVAAGRIAVDHGGSLARDGDALALRVPLWVAS